MIKFRLYLDNFIIYLKSVGIIGIVLTAVILIIYFLLQMLDYYIVLLSTTDNDIFRLFLICVIPVCIVAIFLAKHLINEANKESEL